MSENLVKEFSGVLTDYYYDCYSIVWKMYISELMDTGFESD